MIIFIQGCSSRRSPASSTSTWSRWPSPTSASSSSSPSSWTPPSTSGGGSAKQVTSSFLFQWNFFDLWYFLYIITKETGNRDFSVIHPFRCVQIVFFILSVKSLYKKLKAHHFFTCFLLFFYIMLLRSLTTSNNNNYFKLCWFN